MVTIHLYFRLHPKRRKTWIASGLKCPSWVNLDRSTMSARCPLSTRSRPNRRTTASDVTGHSRRLSNVGMSASPLTPDVGLRRSEPTLRAIRGPTGACSLSEVDRQESNSSSCKGARPGLRIAIRIVTKISSVFETLPLRRTTTSISRTCRLAIALYVSAPHLNKQGRP